jgi:hypothetical protein
MTGDVEWDRIPKEVMNEVEGIRKHEKKSGKEASITVCKQDGKYYTGGDEAGDETSTGVAQCQTKFGKGERRGDIHVHPNTDDRWGGSVLPSPADFTGFIETSFLENSKQVGCVTSNAVPYMHCVQPKTVPTRQKKNEYNKALDRQYNSSKSKKSQFVSFDDPYFQENIHKDFNSSYYDKDSGVKVRHPEAKKVLKCALGNSNRRFRHEVRDMEKSSFCKMIQNLTLPDRDDVGQTCRDEIKKRNILGLIEY